MMTSEHDDRSPASASGDSARPNRSARHRGLYLSGLLVVTALATFGVTALLVTIFEHRQEARQPFVRLVEVDEISTDPRPWGTNWPFQFDTYQRTVDDEETQYGGSSAMPASKLDAQPWLRRMYAGYAFSLDYREARGHAYMLYDQEVTERVTERTQSGACLHCHASVIPTYRRLGLESKGQRPDATDLATDFNWPAVMEGFRIASTMGYTAAHAELLRTPDGTSRNDSLFPGGSTTSAAPPSQPTGNDAKPAGDDANAHHVGQAHPVSCIDCHDPQSMQIRVTRPGFIEGIAALAASDAEVPHLPSISRWRTGNRAKTYDPNAHAGRQEMRTFVCAQCHVEYYCAAKETLFYPWHNGLKVEQIEATFEAHKFPDGTDFYDYEHGETGAKVYKAQHPEFELWSQGVHARSGVSCADCHMPYERQGAMKVSSHWVRSPLLSINRSCQTCHNVPEHELRAKVDAIQSRTEALIDRAATAMTDMLDAIRDAQASGATPEQLAPIFELQRRGMWRLDFVSSENSLGFHADQESARILAEAIDYCRQAQARAVALRAPEAPKSDQPVHPVEGITPTEKSPVAPNR